MSVRKGDWVQCRSGVRIWPMDPRPDEIVLKDIAHALSNICRFTGHCSEFYSVAQHSVLVSQFSYGPHGLWFLLHDAPEAYLGDISRPLKRDLYAHVHTEGSDGSPWFHGTAQHISDVEEALMFCIAEALDLPAGPNWSAIKQADDCLLATEARDLMQPLQPDWAKWLKNISPLPDRIEPWEPKRARAEFLKRYEELRA